MRLFSISFALLLLATGSYACIRFVPDYNYYGGPDGQSGRGVSRRGRPHRPNRIRPGGGTGLGILGGSYGPDGPDGPDPDVSGPDGYGPFPDQIGDSEEDDRYYGPGENEVVEEIEVNPDGPDEVIEETVVIDPAPEETSLFGGLWDLFLSPRRPKRAE